MPRTHNGLWPQVISWDNLLRAYQRARRRKRYKPAACRFDADWEAQLLTLQHELATGTFKPGPYHNFRIYEPKPRLISSAPFRDRVVRLAELRFTLHRDKTVVNRTDRGLKFLGFKLYPRGRRMLRDAVRRFRRRVLRYREQLRHRMIPAARLTQAVRAWISHSRYANSEGLRRRLFRELFERGPRAGSRRRKTASVAGAAVLALLRSKTTRGESA